jgi:hypothetical protein
MREDSGVPFDNEDEPVNATLVDPFAAIDAAYAQALAEHNAGTCHLSEWSCSYCEASA